MSRRNKTRLSYPKAIAVVAVLCTFVLVKFQSPTPQKISHKRLSKKHHRKLNEISKASPTIPTLPPMEEQKTVVEPKQESVTLVQNNGLDSKNCLAALSTLGKFQPKLSAKKLKVHTKVVKKRTAKNRHYIALLKKLGKASHQKRITVIPLWIQDELENSELNSQDALDNPSPLDEIAYDSFKEPSIGEVTDKNPLLALVHWNLNPETEFPFELERPLLVQESFFQKLEFTDLKDSLKKYEVEAGVLVNNTKASPQQKLAWSKLSQIPQVTPVVADPKAETHLEVAQNGLEEIVNTQVAEPTLVAGSQIKQIETDSAQEQDLLVSETDKKSLVKNDLKLGPNLASIDGGVQSVLEKTFSVAPKDKIVTTQKAVVADHRPKEQVTSQRSENKISEDSELELGRLYGELSVDTKMVSWLNANKGHIELSLNPASSKDPQDTIFLMDYQFPASGKDFTIDKAGLRGTYQLMAGVYVPSSAVPVAQIPYSKLITAENFKEKIRLEVSRGSIDLPSSRIEANRAQPFVPLTVTVFDGAPSNYRKPKIINNAEVSVVGIPELGKFTVDKEGNARIPRVPTSSELILEVRSPGYMPTRQIVPVFSSGAYAPVYLVQKDKVDVVTQYFTKKPQQSEKSVLMGRVYDVENRNPLAGESLSLSYRKGSAVYFGALPETNRNATLETGLFGFYNIESSIRSIGRGEKKHSLLMDFQPNFGYFIEFGRGGQRSLLGNLMNPFSQQKVSGSIQLVGDANEPSMAEENGKFRLENLDLPNGVVTLEAHADGYPVTWFTVPWSVRESIRANTYYMMETDLIKESASRVARIRHEKNTGVIVGGAHGSLFKNGIKNLRVELINVKGQPVSSEQGPFSMTKASKNHAPYILSAEDPGFAFYNLAPGEYVIKMVDGSGKPYRAHVVRVGVERVSIVVN